MNQRYLDFLREQSSLWRIPVRVFQVWSTMSATGHRYLQHTEPWRADAPRASRIATEAQAAVRSLAEALRPACPGPAEELLRRADGARGGTRIFPALDAD